MAKTPSKLEQLREMREKTGKKPKPKVEVIAKARADAKAAKANKAKPTKPAKKKTNGERGAKTLAVAELLKRSKGCTNSDVKQATGWQSISMPKMAENLGIKLRIEKNPGEPTRYYGG